MFDREVAVCFGATKSQRLGWIGAAGEEHLFTSFFFVMVGSRRSSPHPCTDVETKAMLVENFQKQPVRQVAIVISCCGQVLSDVLLFWLMSRKRTQCPAQVRRLARPMIRSKRKPNVCSASLRC